MGTEHAMTPDEHRAKRGFSLGYPTVDSEYVKQLSKLGKSMGLGRNPEPKITKRGNRGALGSV
ncbi:hypothetical protein [Oricola nitratireducens]|uniref:hypothetical protein n=1 Tax=Oricola nitratireducens TaxID=2775868 RepID=UPI003D17594E